MDKRNMRLSIPDTTELCQLAHSVINSGRPKLSYKHTIAANGTAIAGLPSQIAYGSWQKNLPWYHHLTTLLAQYTMLNFNNNHKQT